MPAPKRGLLWASGLTAAVAAALISWGLAESGRLEARPADVARSMMGRPMLGPTIESHDTAERRTAALVYGAFGALLGLGLGLAGGITVGPLRRTFRLGAAGAAIGAAAGGLAPFLVLPLYLRLAGDSRGELFPALAMHAGLWVPLGLAGGAGLGLGLRLRGPRAFAQIALAGAFGALIATVGYDLLGAFAFPLSETSKPISGSLTTRLLTFLLVACGIAVGSLLGAPRDAPLGPPLKG